MSKYASNYSTPTRKQTAMQNQAASFYATPKAMAGSENYRRGSTSSMASSPPSFGSSSSLYTNTGQAATPMTSHSAQARRFSVSSMSQQQIYSLPEQGHTFNSRNNNTNKSARDTTGEVSRTPGGTPSSGPHTSTMPQGYHRRRTSSLAGVPESVSVQEMAFRQGQRDVCSDSHQESSSPFDRQYDQLWYVFYKLGKECGSQRVPTPANVSTHNFAWPILINPYTQSLDRPNGALDLAWSRKMIQMALNCMQELIRITCRRNTGWDKTVADIPLPAQEALTAFPDLAEQYEQLKRNAREARYGGIPYGY